MKKYLFTLITAIMMATASWAQPIQIGTSTTYWEITGGNTLEITGTGDMPDFVTPSNAPWYGIRNNIYFLEIADAITRIGNSGLRDFTNITTITLPASLVSIGNYGLYGNSRITNIHFPAEFSTLGIDAFGWCTGLTSFTVDAANNEFSAEDGVLFNKTKTELARYPEGKTGNNYTVPATVTEIIGFAFNNCQNLTTVTMLEGLNTLGQSAFYNCSGIETLNLPASLISISNQAFGICTSLSEINVLNSVPVPIDAGVFEGVDKILCTLNVPEDALFAYQSAPVWQDFFEISGGLISISVTVNNPAAGKVTGGDRFYNNGETVILIALANPGCTFLNWTENGEVVHTSSTYSFVATADRELTANFEGTVSISKTVADAIKVYATPQGIAVANATAGETITVYSPSGMQIATAKAAGSETNIAIAARGVYVVRVGNFATKVVF